MEIILVTSAVFKMFNLKKLKFKTWSVQIKRHYLRLFIYVFTVIYLDCINSCINVFSCFLTFIQKNCFRGHLRCDLNLTLLASFNHLICILEMPWPALYAIRWKVLKARSWTFAVDVTGINELVFVQKIVQFRRSRL